MMFKSFTAHGHAVLPSVGKVLCVGVAVWGLQGCEGSFHQTATPPTTQTPPSQHLPWKPVRHVAISNDPPTLDPARMTDLASFNVMVNLHEGLYRYHLKTSKPELALAERVEKNPSIRFPHAQQWRFTLRKHLRWSDGTPFHAQSFCKAWERVLNPHIPSEYAWMLQDIIGSQSEAFLQGKKPLEGLQCPDARHVVVTFKAPVLPYLPEFLASPVSMPIPLETPHRLQGALPFSKGMGAFTLEAWRHGDHLRLRRNPYYWDAPTSRTVSSPVHPPWHTLVFHVISEPTTAFLAFQKKELDVVSQLPPLLLRRLRHTPIYHAQPLQAIQYLAFNTRKPPFHRASLRCAIARTIAPFHTGAAWLKPLLGIDDPVLWGLFPEAQTLKQNEAFSVPPEVQSQLQQRPITLGFKQSFANKRLGESVQWRLKEHLGMRVALAPQEWKAFLHQLHQDPPDMFRLDWYADFPDPDTFTTLFLPDNPNNYTGYQSPAYTRWVTQALHSTEMAQKRALQRRASWHLIREACVVIPLFQPTYSYLAHPEHPLPAVSPMGLVQYR